MTYQWPTYTCTCPGSSLLSHVRIRFRSSLQTTTSSYWSPQELVILYLKIPLGANHHRPAALSILPAAVSPGFTRSGPEAASHSAASACAVFGFFFFTPSPFSRLLNKVDLSHPIPYYRITPKCKCGPLHSRHGWEFLFGHSLSSRLYCFVRATVSAEEGNKLTDHAGRERLTVEYGFFPNPS